MNTPRHHGSWEAALDTFLVPWKRRKDVVGALVCGSFVTGRPNPHSDIDVHIILSDTVRWRERGNRAVGGYLIEYFANPPIQIKKYFRDDFNDCSYMSHVQFSTGRILFDKHGDVRDLVGRANQHLRRRPPALRRYQLEVSKYRLWDHLDNLQDAMARNSRDFHLLYFTSLQAVYTTYARYLRHPVCGPSKSFAVVSNAAARKKYLRPAFPDRRFAYKFTRAVRVGSRTLMLRRFEDLTQHALRHMGGFAIDGWRLRTPLDLGKENRRTFS